ncbi:MAG: Fe-S-containing hydro-lyase [Eubacteriales bacterium]|nr:Fe-S-containing hydro-lyase [Eubacteriales bacterium]
MEQNAVPAKQIRLPLEQEALLSLRAGDVVELSGIIYTARDAAHKKLAALLDASMPLPFPLEGACIYYAGPCPAAPGEVIGPCGPTTSYRMDAYAPRMIMKGLSAMVGKGARGEAVVNAMKGRAVYFAATGGAAYLIAKCIKEAEVIAFPELGAEAVRRLRVEHLPVIVAIDAEGNNLYRQ